MPAHLIPRQLKTTSLFIVHRLHVQILAMFKCLVSRKALGTELR